MEDSYLSAWHTGCLYLGGEREGIHSKRSKHKPHLLPVSCKWIPRRNHRSHRNTSGDLLRIDWVEPGNYMKITRGRKLVQLEVYIELCFEYRRFV